MKVMFSDIVSTGCDQYLDGRLKPLLIQQHVTEAIFNSNWPETREMVHMLETCLTVNFIAIGTLKGCRMGRSDKVSLWYATLLVNTRFRFFFKFKNKQLLSAFNVTLRQRTSE